MVTLQILAASLLIHFFFQWVQFMTVSHSKMKKMQTLPQEALEGSTLEK